MRRDINKPLAEGYNNNLIKTALHQHQAQGCFCVYPCRREYGNGYR